MQSHLFFIVRVTTTLFFVFTIKYLFLSPHNTVFSTSSIAGTQPPFSSNHKPASKQTQLPSPEGDGWILKNNVKIMSLGDSITAGVGSGSKAGYRLPLQLMLTINGYTYDFVGGQTTYNNQAGPVDPEHEGYSGWKISQIDSIVASQIKKYNPDLILLMIGTNNMNGAAWKARSYIENDYTTLLNHIFAASPSVKVIVSPIIYNKVISDKHTNTFNNALKSLVASLASQGYHITFAANMPSQLPKTELADAIHPSDTLYVKMAQVWLYYIKAITLPSPTVSRTNMEIS